ncbi:Sensor histidine kinase TodS [Gimesia panareensis]|uniref:histidine kinase n=1 Tax=Gimesia panareensis TaxID=2527978 RepID=A0A517Q4S8_9PLAN|nr:GAF domain-containing sensor histidine kinase [Gimesia panareensis]QDT26609.1 Sensor histidine kinase TodS [Gimesia panareensis]
MNSTISSDKVTLDVKIAAEFLGKMSQLSRAENRATAEQTLFALLRVIGFNSARLYYLDDRGQLVGARTSGLSKEKRNAFENTPAKIPKEGTRSSTGISASYLAVKHNIPLLVKVSPEHANDLEIKDDRQGIPAVHIQKAPLQDVLGRPHAYQWLDVPLTSEGSVFGKLSLDKQGGKQPITCREFNLIRLLLHPLSDALSASGWFGSTALPHSLIDDFWAKFSKIHSFDELATLITDYVRASFNARNCSLFFAQHPIFSPEIMPNQPDQLVLWSTTFERLKSRCKKDFYLHGQGLTGAAWDSGDSLFVPNINDDGRWARHLNDSQTHIAFVAALIPPGAAELDGVIRIPEGRQHKLLNIDARMLSRFASSVITPAIDSILGNERLRILESLESFFREYLQSRKRTNTHGSENTIWKYAIEAAKHIFDKLADKCIILYSIQGTDIWIEQVAGGLELTKKHRVGGKLPRSYASAVGRMLANKKPILLTNVSEARKQYAYTSVVKGVRSAIVVPLQDDDTLFGAIAMTSNRHDLLATRELEALSLLADQCSELRQLEGIVSKAEKDALAQALEATAYQVKNPALQVRTYGRAVSRDIEKGRQPDQKKLRKLVASIRHIWMSVDRVLYAVENMEPFLDRKLLCIEDLCLGVNEVIDDFAKSYYGKKLLKVQYLRRLPSQSKCNVDREIFETAVLCIAENAMKAVRRKGLVKVSCTYSKINHALRIKIFNDTIGVPGKIQDRIFEPRFHHNFERGKEVVRGAGYGLFVAKKIVEAHQGNITVQSDQNTYAAFTISIPCKE